MPESDIGAILSLAGLIFAVGQFHTHTRIVDRYGVYGSLSFGCWTGVLPISLVPCADSINTTPREYKKLEESQQWKPFVNHFGSEVIAKMV